MVKSLDRVATLLPEWHSMLHSENRFCVCLSGTEETPKDSYLGPPLILDPLLSCNWTEFGSPVTDIFR